MSVITVKNLSFTYPQNNKAALSDVSFGIEKGSYVAIVGYNGCGKSTLARLICGLETPDAGTIKIEENNRIGIIFQSPKEQLVSGIVSRDTAFGPQNMGLPKGEVELRVIESLNVVDMLDRAASSTAALSLGQTQKIALSGTLALRPEILILDEAVSMLDPDSRREILDFIRYWHKCGNTIIQITHDMETLEDADCVIGMEEGRVFYYGTKSAFLKDEENVKRIYGEPLKKAQRNQKILSEAEVSLSVKNLTYYYEGAGAETRHGIFDVSFDLHKGSLTALTGASGAGKSTVLELCSGLMRPESGEICSREGRPVLAQQNAKSALFEGFAADDVAFGARNRGLCGSALVETVKHAMDAAALPFDQFAERRTFELSGGEQRRLSIAGIIALNEKVLMFDEPTAGLDSRSRMEVMALLRRLAEEGKTVLFTTHKRDEADFADREIAVKDGRLVSDSLQAHSSADCDKNTLLPPLDSAGLIESLKSAAVKISNPRNNKKTQVERIFPALRILLFLFLFVMSLAARPLWLCGLMLAVAALYCLLCGFSLRKLLAASIKILPFLLIFSIFQMMFHPALADEPHFTNWKWFMVTPSKLFFCLAAIIRTNAALACISGFFVSTPEYDLMDGLNVLLTPLRLIKIPVHYLILIIEVIFRFIPLLLDEAAGIIKTQTIRGGLGKVKGRLAKIRAVIPLVVPLIIQTIKRSELLADAITMRCFK